MVAVLVTKIVFVVIVFIIGIISTINLEFVWIVTQRSISITDPSH